MVDLGQSSLLAGFVFAYTTINDAEVLTSLGLGGREVLVSQFAVF